ncbi:MAG: LbtU family siderophore porin [Desulfobacteraceae bacterium]|nr:LbtU family siderophore porin [Desulfobacteraceae bacterium]
MKKTILFLSCLFLVCALAGPMPAQEKKPSDQSGKTSQSPDDNNEKRINTLEERIKNLEDYLSPESPGNKWYERIKISGVIEAEAWCQETAFRDPSKGDEDTSDVDLAAVELAGDIDFIGHVSGHIMYKYEDDDVFLDEGFITLTGTEEFPAYLIAGRQYIPFGFFDTHFITDPNTLILGETNEGAAVAGHPFAGGMIDVSLGAFNGEVHEDGDDEIDSFVASIASNPFENLTIGASYTSNLAGSDSLSEEVAVGKDNLDSLVAGWNVFACYEFLERFRAIGEYVAALDEFNSGELYSTSDASERKPSAWSLEFGATIMENLEAAVRYGGSDDGAEFIPETQYGAVINWEFFENTNLAVEYLHAEFEHDAQETDSFTAQLAFVF